PAIAKPSSRTRRPGGECPRVVLLLAIAMSGFAALALEVVWMRILIQSFSATAYAFSIMLACFLAGIFWGSKREARWVDSLERPAGRVIRRELGLFAYVALLAVLPYVVPGFFGTLLWSLTALTGGGFGPASIAAQAVAAVMLIIAPTVWLGSTLP